MGGSVIGWGRAALLVGIVMLFMPSGAWAGSLFGAGFASPSMGGLPDHLVTDRFDTSGNPDIALITGSRAEVDVLLGDGHGGLSRSSGSPLLSGGSYFGITTGDFNGDGNEDIAVTDYSAGTVTALLGNGDGTFRPPGLPIAVGSHAADIVAGAFTSGSPEDLAVRVDGGVEILAGNGDGTFTVGSLIGPSNPVTLGVGYFGSNGAPDLVVAGSDGNVTMLMNDGSANFTALQPVSAGVSASTARPESIAAGYFQNASTSTLQDVAVGFDDGEASVLLNQSAHPGTLSLASGSPVHVTANSTQLPSVVAADVNGDGKTDLVGGGYWQGGPGAVYNSVGVMLGDDRGGLTPAPGSPYLVDGVAGGVATGSFYGTTGKLDVATADGGSCNGNVVEVLRNQGASGPGPQTGTFAGDGCSVPASASGSQLNGTADSPFSGTVAHIDDLEYTAGYSAQIDWGDGQGSAGAVSRTYPPGFDVSGSHTYASPGTYTITVHLIKTAGAGTGLTRTAISTIAVDPSNPTITVGTSPPGSSVVLVPPGGRDCSQPCDGRFAAQVRGPSGAAAALVSVHVVLDDAAGKVVQSGDQYTDPHGLIQLDFPDVEGVGIYTVIASITDSSGATRTAHDVLRVHPTTIGTVHVEPALVNQPVGSSVTVAVAVFDSYGNQYTSDPHGMVPVNFVVDYENGSHSSTTATIEQFSTTGNCAITDLVFGCPGSAFYTGAEPVLSYQPFANDRNVANDAALLDVADRGGAGLESVGIAVPDPGGGPPHGPTAPDRNPILNFQSPNAPGVGTGVKSNSGAETRYNVAGAGLACAASLASLSIPGVDVFGAVAAYLSCGGATAAAVGTQISIGDPPDLRYHAVFLPVGLSDPSGAAVSRVRRVCRRHASAARCAAVERAGHRYEHVVNLVGSVQEALAVSIDRYQGARQHGDALAMFAQQGAIDAYLGRLSQLVTERGQYGRAWVFDLRAAGFRTVLSRSDMRRLVRALSALRGIPASLVRRFRKDGLIANRAGLAKLLGEAVAHAGRLKAIDLLTLLGSRLPTLAFSRSYERIGFSQLLALIRTLGGQRVLTSRASSSLFSAVVQARARCTVRQRDHAMVSVLRRLRGLRGAAGALLREVAQPLARYRAGTSPPVARCGRRAHRSRSRRRWR